MRRLTLLIAGMACEAAFNVRPANAEDTVVTFTVAAGPLSVTVPASASIGTGEPGTTITGTFAPGTSGPLSSTPPVAFTHTGGTGGNSASWNPGLSIAVPNTATAVTYTAAVTHLVA